MWTQGRKVATCCLLAIAICITSYTQSSPALTLSAPSPQTTDPAGSNQETLPAATTIIMARATWDTGWFQAEVYKLLLEQLGYTVLGPFTMENPEFYRAVAEGEVDFWANGWLPLHNSFLQDEALASRISPVGYQVQQGALQGYLIDKETAETHNITSLTDLQDPDLAALFDTNGNGRANLIGCNTGWSCAQFIDHHLDAYDLQETVQQIQGDYSPMMADVVNRYRQGQPILFYTWTPNWTVGTLVPGTDLVWLEVPFAALPDEPSSELSLVKVTDVAGCPNNPCALGFPPNDIRVVANNEFLEEQPAAALLLEAVTIPLDDIHAQNARMLAGEDDTAAIQRHAAEWVERNGRQVEQWLALARPAAIAGGLTPIESATAFGPDFSPLQAGSISTEGKLAVVTQRFEPFVIYQDQAYSGFSIELWQRIAAQIDGLEYELYGVNTLAKMLDDVERGVADVGIAGIGITSHREQRYDFSHAYFNAGFQILVPDRSGFSPRRLLATIAGTLLSAQLLAIVGFFFVVLLIVAHVIWLLERRHNPDFPEGYLAGMGESIWWAVVTVTTVGYGDKTPKRKWGRVFGMFWILAGYFAFAYFTAGVASSITLQGIEGRIAGPQDLPGHRIATVERSPAATYLDNQGLRPVKTASLEEAYQLLATGDVDAVVYDAPVLQYYAAHAGRGQVRLAGLPFEEVSYGIVTPVNSPYRKEINLALLHLLETGEYQEIYHKWFEAEGP